MCLTGVLFLITTQKQTDDKQQDVPSAFCLVMKKQRQQQNINLLKTQTPAATTALIMFLAV